MARSFVLGIDCKLYMNLIGDRGTVPADCAAYITALPGSAALFTLVSTVQDVTLNLSASTADLTNRASNGWRQIVSALKEGSADFSILWTPDDATGVFQDLLQAYIDQCPRAFMILDGPNTGMAAASGRCGESGVVTGLYADFAVTSFARNEALEEGVTADVTIEVGKGIVTPCWIELPTI